jgi:uncharacterized protein
MNIFIILFIVALLLILLSVSGYYLARIAVLPEVHPSEETYRVEIEKGRLDPQEFEAWERKELHLPSKFGYDLYALYFPLSGSQRCVVLSHGHTWSLYGMVKYARLFRQRGYNLLLYDLRYHGKSGGKNMTFGFYEQHDLRLMVDWAFRQMGPGGMVGTMGESLGAAITLLEAANDPRLNFVISDCAFSDLNELLTYRKQEMFPWLPNWPFMPLTDLFSFFITGMRFKDVCPLQAAARINIPALFIHGLEDRYIPTPMGEALYAAKNNGYRQLYLAPGARHAESLVKNKEAYEEVLDEFLNRVERGNG